MALDIILRFDVAQELRPLSIEERAFRARLKRRVIGLATLDKARKRQSSRVTNLKLGNASTRYFHICINARRRKNHILRLKHNNGWVTNHEGKQATIHNHFKNIIERGPPRRKDFNWSTIPRPNCDHQDFDAPFMEEEVKTAIVGTASDKAPGPDGYRRPFSRLVGL
jgi:hypothetical protein